MVPFPIDYFTLRPTLTPSHLHISLLNPFSIPYLRATSLAPIASTLMATTRWQIIQSAVSQVVAFGTTNGVIPLGQLTD